MLFIYKLCIMFSPNCVLQKTLAVLTKRTLNSPVFDIVSTGRAANELTLVTGFGKQSTMFVSSQSYL